MQVGTIEPQGARDLLQGAERIADVDQGATGRGRRAREGVVDESDARARIERSRDEVVPVARALQRNEASAVAQRARVEGPRLHRGIFVADNPAGRAPRDLAGGEPCHEHASNSSIATARSSKGVVIPAKV